jgi:hypothetical protein
MVDAVASEFALCRFVAGFLRAQASCLLHAEDVACHQRLADPSKRNLTAGAK